MFYLEATQTSLVLIEQVLRKKSEVGFGQRYKSYNTP